jgi:hypothetical protein
MVEDRGRRRSRAPHLDKVREPLLVGLLALVVLFGAYAVMGMFPIRSYGVANDWRVYYAAAQMVRHGGALYNQVAAQVARQAVWAYPQSRIPANSFLDLPIVAWLLTPITLLPFWASFVVSLVIGVLAAGIALAVWMRDLGWQRFGPWLIAALALRPMLQGFGSGQLDAIMLGAVVCSLLLLRRNLPWLAGLCMAVVLLKPDLLWPLPVLLFAAWTPGTGRPWRFAGAAALVIAAGGLGGFVLVARSGDYFAHVLSLSSSSFGNAPSQMSGIPELLTHLPGGGALGDGVALIGALCVLVLAGACLANGTLRRLPDRERGMVVLIGLAIWLACTTYVHFYDDALMLPLVVGLIGVRGQDLDLRWMGGGVLGCLGIMAAVDVSWILVDVILLILIALWVARRRLVSPQSLGSVAVAAIVLLQLDESLFPAAVGLVAFTGVLWLVAKMRETPPVHATPNRSLVSPILV